MADIIDIGSRRQKNDTLRELGEMLGMNVSENGMIEQTIEAVAVKMAKLMLVTSIVKEASELIEAAGFDPNDFELEEETLDTYLGTEIGEGDLDSLTPNQIWNGPRFSCQRDGYEVCVAATVVLNDSEEASYSIDVMKLRKDSTQWLIWSEGKWLPGPPEEAFRYIDAIRSDGDDDYDWDDDDDDDYDEEWEASIDSMLLPPNVIGALHMAGIDRIDELKRMTNAQLLAIKGIGKKSLVDIREALKYED